MTEIAHRFVETNGIRMHLAEEGEGPLVVLLHGFPESWYSWRHQLQALAEAGYHAVAPDQRGYGQTDRPAEIEKYTQLHLVGDVIGLLDALGEEQAVVVGHDWGAPVAWNTALLRPDRVRGVVGLSVPYCPRGPVSMLTAHAGAARRRLLHAVFPGTGRRRAPSWRGRRARRCGASSSGLSGDAPRSRRRPAAGRARDRGFLDSCRSQRPCPAGSTEADLDSTPLNSSGLVSPAA